jgi:hypothetical protein
VTNFATSSPCVVDTGGKFATGVNDTGGKLLIFAYIFMIIDQNSQTNQ